VYRYGTKFYLFVAVIFSWLPFIAARLGRFSSPSNKHYPDIAATAFVQIAA